jgi:hypothetical protein
VTVRRLRPLPSPDELAAMYPSPHDHTRYGQDHAVRVEGTIALGKATLGPWFRDTIADLSAGNGAIAKGLALDDSVLHLGDVAGLVKGADVDYLGPIEQTLLDLPHVDLFICSETIEHLDSPFTVLGEIRRRADRLLLSTPVGCWNDSNPEHLWCWSRHGVEALLRESGWNPVAYDEIDGTVYHPASYVFGLWVAR